MNNSLNSIIQQGVNSNKLRIYISCCKTNMVSEALLVKRLVNESSIAGIILVNTPDEADIILIIDIKEANVFQNLRENQIWKQYPDRSFGYYEGDNPPSILHGVYSSATQTKGYLGRMQSSAYPLAEYWLPNLPQCGKESYLDFKKHLISFTGRHSHPIRKKLFKLDLPESLLVDTTLSYNHFSDDLTNKEHMQRYYWERLRESKFALCPRGAGASSVRLFQVMSIGVAPVIISDKWIPPIGPDWHEFALFLPESRISSVYEFVKLHENEFEKRGRAAKKAYDEFFSQDRILDQIVRSMKYIDGSQVVSEKSLTSSLSWLIVALEWIYQARYRSEVYLKNILRSTYRLIIGNDSL